MIEDATYIHVVTQLERNAQDCLIQNIPWAYYSVFYDTYYASSCMMSLPMPHTSSYMMLCLFNAFMRREWAIWSFKAKHSISYRMHHKIYAANASLPYLVQSLTTQFLRRIMCVRSNIYTIASHASWYVSNSIESWNFSSFDEFAIFAHISSPCRLFSDL